MTLTSEVISLRGSKAHWRRYFFILVLLLAASAALLWSWNEVAASHFGAPVLRFRHALAPLVALTLVVALLRAIWERGRNGLELPGR